MRVHAAERIGDADRFDLLVPIRELAMERLREEEPDGSTLDRHADHFARAVRLDPDGTREDRAALTAVVEAEWPNIRTALEPAARPGPAPGRSSPSARCSAAVSSSSAGRGPRSRCSGTRPTTWTPRTTATSRSRC